ncbi:MAG TPA: hypothetical protein V6D50_12870 [Chroococcales cyanobacterium]
MNGTDLGRKLQVLEKTRTWGFPQTPIAGQASPQPPAQALING